MVMISTFVIFDIETTGLPRYERNRTKITELTFLAVDRRDIEQTPCGGLPLLNKLSYLYNPLRKIQSEVTQLTGLTNSSLSNQRTFEQRMLSLMEFLNELPKPVCLVAHNGNSFDFKILRTEFENGGYALPDDLLCVDSLGAFKKILKETNLRYETIMAMEMSKSDDDILTDDEEWPELHTSAEEWDEIDRLIETYSNTNPCVNSSNSSLVVQSDVVREKDKIAAIQKVFDRKPYAEKICFKLEALYKRLLNKEAVNAHRSEADCLMLLECIVAVKNQFLPYADDKCKSINKVKQLFPF